MPDLASILVRSSIGTLPPSTTACGGCHRTPLAGELMHEVAGGRTLCDLCFAGLPEDRRVAVRTGDIDAGIVSAGMVVGLIRDIPTCAELLERIVRECRECLRRASAMMD